MKKITHIVIVEPSDLIFEGLSTILYNSDSEFSVSRLLAFEDIESILENRKVNITLINPALIFNNEKEIKKIRKYYPELLIACVNTAIVDNYTTNLYDFTFNIYDSSTQILSTIKKQLNQKHIANNSNDDSETLSERESEVLLKIIKGHTNKEIAEILCISVHTVISHRKNIMIKTGIRSQSGLALYAVSKSLISLDDFDL